MTAEFSRLSAAPSTVPIRRGDSLAGHEVANGTGDLRYLAFVDGLRALSILAVVAFHVGVPGVPGGFVGVDVFFVISGFLIINQIKAGLGSGRFSIVRFYAHRTLRILPPYLIVLLATFAVAPFILPTTAVDWDFLPSALLSPLMGTNVVFYLSQGYFDIAAIEKPLLHTWTLSVEEQFYLVAPILLLLVFRLGNRRFGAAALTIGLVLGAVSLAGAITRTSASGPNAAFYLAHWRAWEFLAGGLIGAQLVAATRRLPRAILEAIGWIGIGCIAYAAATFDPAMPYPSWHAMVPVAGATLMIVCGLAQPQASAARFLSLRFMVAIGLVSYGWYLWHWPILSFIRIARLNDTSLLVDGLGGGVLALALACLSYRYVESPIRRWRRTPGNLTHPGRVVLGFVAACVVMALLGGASALGSYVSTKSFLAAHYGVEGEGVLDNGCENLTNAGFPDHCFEGATGIILGDSHASMLFGSFAKKYDALGLQLVSIARGSCDPLLLAPSVRAANHDGDCARLTVPFERLLARPDPIPFAIISGNWLYNDWTERVLSELIGQFDRTRTRILLLGPVPIFHKSSLECIVLSDRFYGNRDRCVRPRGEVEAMRAKVVAVLRRMPQKFGNLRYVDPIDVFCDQTTCRPYTNDQALYSDEHHVLPSGADRIFNAFKGDFLWLAGKAPTPATP